MQAIFPYNATFLVAENEKELESILSYINANRSEYIEEISHFFSNGLVHVYILEHDNSVLIVKYAGDFNANTDSMIADFYVANGFNY